MIANIEFCHVILLNLMLDGSIQPRKNIFGRISVTDKKAATVHIMLTFLKKLC